MIHLHLLGKPGRDNAVYLVVNTGQSTSRLLFDCGYGCLDALAASDIMSLDAVFFSHFHMDHISGFDALFRFNYNRSTGTPLHMIGPIDTLRVLQHRMQAYTWNLVNNARGSVIVCEYGHGRLRTCELPTKDAFRTSSREESMACTGIVYSTPDLSVSAIELDHGCICAGYVVREMDRVNVDMSCLSELGLSPGPWLQQVKAVSDVQGNQFIEIDGKSLQISELRNRLLKVTPGGSFAYLTDFRPSAEQKETLVDFIRGVDVLVCENSYTNADIELARQNFHLTSREVGELAAAANVGGLVPFHLSDRYTVAGWQQQLDEMRAVFPRVDWPTEWEETMLPLKSRS